MAIIVKCASCKARLNHDTVQCPSCGSVDKKFFIDYRPDGRNGTRRQRELDENIKTLDVALELDRLTKQSIRDRRRPDLAVQASHYSITFDELFDDYMDWYRMEHRTAIDPIRQEKTFREREETLNIFSSIIGPMPVTSFNKDEVLKYQLIRSKMKTRRGTEVKNATINKELAYVAGFLKWCRTKKGILMEPLEYDELSSVSPIPIVLSPDEVIRLINAAEPFWQAFFLCLYTIGLRFSEAAFLHWRDIDRENNIIRVTQKGGTDKIEVLNAWLDNALKKLPRGNPDDYIFLIKRTGRPVTTAQRAIERAVKKAGIIKKVTPHLLRHSIATHLVSRGTNLRTVQKFLGHSQVQTTEIYTHIATDDIRNATDDMFKAMQKKAKTNRQHPHYPHSTNGNKKKNERPGTAQNHKTSIKSTKKRVL